MLTCHIILWRLSIGVQIFNAAQFTRDKGCQILTLFRRVWQLWTKKILSRIIINWPDIITSILQYLMTLNSALTLIKRFYCHDVKNARNLVLMLDWWTSRKKTKTTTTTNKTDLNIWPQHVCNPTKTRLRTVRNYFRSPTSVKQKECPRKNWGRG